MRIPLEMVFGMIKNTKGNFKQVPTNKNIYEVSNNASNLYL